MYRSMSACKQDSAIITLASVRPRGRGVSGMQHTDSLPPCPKAGLGSRFGLCADVEEGVMASSISPTIFDPAPFYVDHNCGGEGRKERGALAARSPHLR